MKTLNSFFKVIKIILPTISIAVLLLCFPKEIISQSVNFITDLDPYELAPGGKLKLLMEASDTRELTEVFFEVHYPDGVKIDTFYLCGGTNEPCLIGTYTFRGGTTITVKDLGYTSSTSDCNFINLFPDNCIFDLRAVSVTRSNIRREASKLVQIGWSSDKYNPRGESIKVFRRCNRAAERNIEFAYDLLRANAREILETVTFHRRFGRNRAMRSKKQGRMRNRYIRRIDRLRKVKCDGPFCRGLISSEGRSGGAFQRRVSLCYEQFFNGGSATGDFCELFGLLAHELGHMTNIPWKRGKDHNCDRKVDNIYSIHSAAIKWCQNNCHNFKIDRR